jgi:hypothetical protein
MVLFGYSKGSFEVLKDGSPYHFLAKEGEEISVDRRM